MKYLVYDENGNFMGIMEIEKDVKLLSTLYNLYELPTHINIADNFLNLEQIWG